MDIWPPPPLRLNEETVELGNSRIGFQPLVSAALGVVAGLLGSVIVSALVLMTAWHIPYLGSHGCRSFLALPIAIGLGSLMLRRNKIFALSCMITAAGTSTILALFIMELDGLGPPE